MDQVDAAIIGFGAASKPLALDLASAGFTVAVIERSSRMYGGACVNTACLPSKMLVHAAAVSAFEGGEFPARAERYEAVIDEKNEATARLRERSYRTLADNPRIEVIDGEATFVDATYLSVRTADGERQLEAARTFIDTGSVPALPDIPGADGKRVYTSESLLDVKILPERTVIVGAGYVGLEFASLFADFGVDVTVLQSGEDFLPREDADMARAVRENFEQRGIKLMLGAQVKSLEDDVAQVLVIADVDGKEVRLPGDFALVATGRRPATDGLNLEAAGVQVDRRGAIVTDEHLRTTAPNIWALGDVAGGLQFTYISLDDSRIVKEDVLGDGARTTANRGTVPYSVFLDPPFSRAGMTEQEARDAGFDVKVAKLPAAAIPKAQLLHKPTGLLKAVVDADTGRILGAHLFCEESYEMINTVKLAMDAGLPYQVLRDAVYTHPTMSEAFNDLFAQVG